MGISAALGSSALLPAGLGFRNKIINGNMVISQRGTSAVSNVAGANAYGTDRWHLYGELASKMTIAQSTNNPAGQGFSHSTLVTSSAATTPTSNHYYGLRQVIEGYNMSDLAWGTSGAKPIVVSFWVRSSIAGTYSFSLFNGDSNRSLISTYIISSADTWEKKTIYVTAGDTGGVWNSSNGAGLSVWFDLGSGTSTNGTAGVWNTSLLVRTSGSVNWVGTNGATFYVTGVQLEQNLQPTPFEQRPIGLELALCHRYYKKETGLNVYMPATGYTQQRLATVHHGIPLRAAPTTYSFTSTTAMAAYLVVTVGVLSAYNVVGSVSTEIAFTAYEVSAEL